MKFVWFVHAIASCWNNGNAHFLRGLALALQAEGHEVLFCEPRGAWSEQNLIADHGDRALDAFGEQFPTLTRHQYDAESPDLRRLVSDADVVVVHEWNAPSLIEQIGQVRRGFLLLFHDTHHRAVTDPSSVMWKHIARFDGVLAFGEAVSNVYRQRGWNKRVFTLHEAADISTFHPLTWGGEKRDLIWIGNWGDEERTAELRDFLSEPVHRLGLTASVYGVRYPARAIEELRENGLDYFGWLPNHLVPAKFAQHKLTVHVPRGPYARQLPGIPTIRVFEALACGIPLVSAPWDDEEGLFPEECYLVARDGAEMQRHMRSLLRDPGLAAALSWSGLAAVRARHTCAHRARQLLDICAHVRQLLGVAQCA